MAQNLSIADFAKKAKAAAAPTLRGRMIFGLDATGSRESTWQTAKALQRDMLSTVAQIGTLDVSLAYFRGDRSEGDVGFSDFTTDPNSLAVLMDGINCSAGPTQIIQMFEHALTLHAQTPINALVFIGDTMEESFEQAKEVCSRIGASGMQLFIFHEGSAWKTFEHASELKEMARLGHGAYAVFSEASASELASLLKAVAAFATGGMKALMKQDSEAAKLLIGQLKS